MTAAFAAAMPVLPLVCALVGLVLPAGARRLPAALGIAGAAGVLVLAVVVAAGLDGLVETSHTLASFGSFDVTLGVRVDAAAAWVAIPVATTTPLARP